MYTCLRSRTKTTYSLGALVEEQYIKPTSSGRVRALVPSTVYLLGGLLVYWLAGIVVQRNEATLSKYSPADYSSFESYLEAIAAVVSQHLLEVAWIRFLCFLVIAGHIVWMTRAIQIAGQWPIPNTPVLFRTRVRSDPRFIKWVVILGYVAGGLTLFNSLLGFYAWYVFRNSFRSVTN